MKVTALGNTLTGFGQALATTLGVDTTSSSPNCAEMMVVFARGTSEPGNVGLFSGPTFFDALEVMMGAGAVSVQGVEYGASIEGFLQGGDPAGSAAMAGIVEGTVQNCPNAKIVMSGYSQGGQLVHNAAAMLPAATMAKISSLVIFGDPNDGKPIANADPSKVMVVCHPGHNICDGRDLVLVEHLTYSRDAVEAATFAAARAKA
uniref:Cutinase pbc1 n=1 Tax=Pyrenopeziza brassicae TaxID=76659 RepID=CUTI_PYRBR|nr:RecName: Full=Cutinase pbc1; AltName: Full=Cutin hydrolase; Flags: Precursor [Pyrenopeziza brassicae]CAB40372.1 cutinase [Pyrenopeziza brassicae]